MLIQNGLKGEFNSTITKLMLSKHKGEDGQPYRDSISREVKAAATSASSRERRGFGPYLPRSLCSHPDGALHGEITDSRKM